MIDEYRVRRGSRRSTHDPGDVMAKLIYAALTSLDHYVADTDGTWGWAAPSDEVHAAVNDVERSAGTHLYGRRMYDVLKVWETMDDPEPEMRDFAELWRAAEKVVYSRTLERPETPRTRIERSFEPEAVRAWKEQAAADLTIGGPELAGQAIAAGLVDELHLFVSPVVVGGGNPALPEGVKWELELLAERRFANGVVHTHYRTRP
jgi:dihydrofolate reductase